jgi:hypothetical protein
LDHFPSQPVVEQILSTVWATKEHGQYSPKPSGVRALYSLPPSAYRAKKGLIQLVCDFFTKPGSDTSLLQKDAESAAASSEHKNAHNQQTVHRHNSEEECRERRLVQPPASFPASMSRISETNGV